VFYILLVNNHLVAILQNKPNNTRAGFEEHRHLYFLLNMTLMGELYVIDSDLLNSSCIISEMHLTNAYCYFLHFADEDTKITCPSSPV